MLTGAAAAVRPAQGPTCEPTNRIRIEGTRNLIAAARAAGARRVDRRERLLLLRARGRTGSRTRRRPLDLEAPGKFGAAVARADRLGAAGAGGGGARGTGPALRLVLRARHLLSAPAARRPRKCASGATRSSARGRRPSPSSTSRTRPAAVVAALERGAPGVYNVVDDEPAPLREWLPVFAEALGAKPPRRVPAWLVASGRRQSGGTHRPSSTRGASNAKAKRELGWQPAHPSWRQGFAELVRAR